MVTYQKFLTLSAQSLFSKSILMKKIYSTILPLFLTVAPVAASDHQNFVMAHAPFGDLVEMLTPRVLDAKVEGLYATNVSENQNYTRGDRHLDGVGLNGSAIGNQKFEIATPRKVYTKALNTVFLAKPGEKLTPVFMYTGSWMNSYLYLDRNQNGVFDAVLDANKRIPEGSDIMTFSNYDGVNSNGESTGNQNRFDSPAFTLPADLPYGIYRMRYKVDWSSIDPAGRPEDGNGMLKNGGAICDVLLNVHGDKSNLIVKTVNGALLGADGQPLTNGELPFGKGFAVKLNPKEGFACESVRLRYGYHLDGEQVVNGNLQYQEKIIPGYLIKNNEIEVPDEYVAGDLEIEALFFEDKGNAEGLTGDYPLHFDKELKRANEGILFNNATFKATKGGTSKLLVNNADNLVYCDLTSQQVSVVPGDDVAITTSFSNKGLHTYLYVDFGQDGRFSPIVKENGKLSSASELVSYTYYHGFNSEGEAVADAQQGDMAAMPSFHVPEMLSTGCYRARLKVDFDNIDPAGQWKEGGENQIDAQGGYVVDFLLNVHNAKHDLLLSSINGNIYGSGKSALPVQVDAFQNLTIEPTPVATGYAAERMTIKHGHHFDGPQYVHGNKQWSEYEVSTRTYTIPKDSVNGDLAVSVNFVEQENAVYKLVFSDEFDGEDFTEPVSDKWSRCQRQGATWNRWLSDSKDVVYMKDGNLVTRAIPNPDQKSDPVPMITGGIKSQKKFGFTYGKVECRAKSMPWVGNFPAIWLMPEDQSAGWPGCGEIDIFEAIDAQQTAYGTIHSHWTYDLGHKNDPKSAFNTGASMDRYHTYGLEWDARNVRWYVDGKLMGTYSKSTNKNALDNGQWVFDKHFYLILNQSVGNGSWARPADVNHTYEFFIDWVRVYQKKGMENTNGVVGLMNVSQAEALEVNVVNGGVEFYAEMPTQVVVYDLQGRQVYRNMLNGAAQIRLDKGIYVVNGKKVFVR